MVERRDPGYHRSIVLCEREAIAPEVGCRLVFFRITPGFLRGRPFRRDLARRRAGPHRLDRIVEPLERRRVDVLLLLARLLADAIGPVITGLVTVPGERREIHEHDIARLDDAIGKIAP